MPLIPEPVKTWSPSDCSVIVNGYRLSGFVDGSFVTVERMSDRATMKEGVDGVVTRSLNPSKASTITIRLQQRSMSNSVLAALERAGTVFPFLFMDTVNGERIAAGQAWISKVPSLDFAKESGDREWTLQTSGADWSP